MFRTRDPSSNQINESDPAYNNAEVCFVMKKINWFQLISIVLITELIGDMPRKHRDFLISFEEGKPDWDLIGIPDAAKI